MNTREYQICTRCLMDTTDPQISFCKMGYCNHCRHFIETKQKYLYEFAKSEKQLKAIIHKIKKKGKGKEYDCIVGISGGADSSYVAYLCQSIGLRILAVHVDNGWNSPEANLNIKNVVQKLNIHYESYVLDWEEFKDLQLSFLKAAVPELETPTDIALIGALHKVAAKYGVKYIISGGNMSSEGILPKCWHYNAKDLKYLNAVHNKFGSVKLKKFPMFSWVTEIYCKFHRWINILYILQYVPYIAEDVKIFLKKEIDWKYYGGKHYESKYTRFVQSFYLYEKFGIDYRRATFSSQICTGEISRDKALETLKQQPYDLNQIEDDKNFIAKKLDIKRDEFEEILRIPGKFYFEYPNDEKKLDFIYTIYRKLFKKEKLASV